MVSQGPVDTTAVVPADSARSDWNGNLQAASISWHGLSLPR